MYVLAPDNIVQTWPYSIVQLKFDNPETSFPASIDDPETASDELLASYNVFPVTPTEAPAYNEQTQRVEEVNPTFDGSTWSEAWQIIELTPEQQELNTQSRAQEVRQRRDTLLEQCDWTQLPDSPVDPAAWTTYRQELRDVPQQAGFPWNVTWPIPPLT